MENYLTARISASAVKSNLELLRSHLATGVKMCPVVKADCYGHGLEQLLPVISPYADALAVATPQEAVTLRRMGCDGEVLVFFSACAFDDGRQLQEALEELIRRDILLTVVAEREVSVVAEAAARAGRTARLHVKVDTGMSRSGVTAGQAGELINTIRHTDGVKLAGLYTHFAVADDPAGDEFTRGQLSRFLEVAEAAGGRDGLTLHAANSAALIDYPQTQLDMVRPGIAVYGYQPSDDMNDKPPLCPCMQLVGRLIQVKDIPAGSQCGYGLTQTFSSPARIGLVPVGYGDGYFRCLSNRAVVRIDGVEAPIRGRVSMDQIIVELTHLPHVEVGDEVEIISPDSAAPNSVENLARLAGTIPYEVTCRLGNRIRRTLVD